MMTNNRTQNRRGVTLLFVISMIVLFLLMGTTFVIVANDFLKTSRRSSRITVNSIESLGENPGERFLTRALYDLLRGPDLNNVNSPLRGHSLLADMYGYGFVAYVENVENELIEKPNPGGNPDSQPQFIRLQLIGSNENIYNKPVTNGTLDGLAIGNDILSGKTIYTSQPSIVFDPSKETPYELLPSNPGRFNGQLLTFVSGQAAGVTTRIIDHQVFPVLPAGGPPLEYEHRFVVLLLNPGANLNPSNIDENLESYDAASSELPTRVVINGRPFAGTGAGVFDTMQDFDMPALSNSAMMPNQTGESLDDLRKQYLGRTAVSQDNTPLASVPNSYAPNESYDALDLQNVFLAGTTSTGVDVFSFGENGTGTSFIPPKLMNEKVDFDNDGNDDGIWIDPGYPTFNARNGKRVKAMISYRVVDLDSKINVNVHGNRAQIASNDRFTIPGNPSFVLPAADQLSPLQIPFGNGMGPAEVFLGAVFSSGNEDERLMVGEFSASGMLVNEGRYGSSENNLGHDIGGGPAPGQGYISAAEPGRDPFSSYKQFGHPNGFLGDFFQSSPMDIYGRFHTVFPNTVLDGSVPISMPIIDVLDSNLMYSDIINNPYEVDFSPPPKTGSSYDHLFSLDELEQVYRRGDIDLVGRPANRLTALAKSLADPTNRLAATTDSWEVPTIVQDFVQNQDPNQNGVHLETLMGKLYAVLKTTDATANNAGFGITTPGLTEIEREQLILTNISGFFHDIPNRTFNIGPNNQSLMSAEVRAGRPFDVNRPFGNGIDDDNDGIVDEPGEVANEQLPQHPDGTMPEFDHNNDSVIAATTNNAKRDAVQARQSFARQLYILVLLATELVDRNGDGDPFDNDDFYNFDGLGTASVQDRIQYRRVIAQWAVNVADFRDSDSIMTPFEVDLNPWNGWDVNGDVSDTDGGSERAVFWGVERPELLITETLVMHDGRTQDRDDDNVDMDTTMNLGGTDEDVDSRFTPNASAFFELYHPWVSPGNQILPGELDVVNSPNPTGVDLLQLDGDMMAPVWRMVAANHRNIANVFADPVNFSFDFEMDPDIKNEFGGLINLPDSSIRRYIYFNKPNAGLTDPEFAGPKVYHPVSDVTGLNNLVVEPGNYAILGSSGIQVGTTYRTFLGRLSGHADGIPVVPDDTRRIELELSGSGNLNGQFRYFPGTDPAPGGAGEQSSGLVTVLPIIQLDDGVPATPIRSLGLTDPVNGYAILNQMMMVAPEGDGFAYFDASNMQVTLDEPVDKTLDTSISNGFYKTVLGGPDNAGQLGENQLFNGAFVILLQRLANPLEPWNDTTNPYLTIDSTSSDVFAFNGLESQTSAPNFFFGSFERRAGLQDAEFGQDDFNMNFVRNRMLWKTEYQGLLPTGDSALSDGSHVLNTELVHSFGRINDAYINGFDPSASDQLPFAWLNWNNRPYATALELANVPFTSSYFLTNRFDTSQKNFNSNWNPYASNGRNVMGPNGFPVSRSASYAGEFPHLLNFHDDVHVNPQNSAALLHRIFDYIEVPSRYVGTETFLNPTNFVATAVGGEHHFTRSFAPPFDKVSNFRDPGKININTISDSRVWDALMGNYATQVPFDDWKTSREASPYRASNAANRVSANVSNPADTGLFRRDAGGDPLFDFKPGTDPLSHADRNAYFKYHMRNRLGNMVTMRSSVFAIWITVGYFEVENIDGVDRVSDDELENDFGQTTRNRAFFIVDRSIPVAFEPGKNHNVQRAIRVSSYIE